MSGVAQVDQHACRRQADHVDAPSTFVDSVGAQLACDDWPRAEACARSNLALSPCWAPGLEIRRREALYQSPLTPHAHQQIAERCHAPREQLERNIRMPAAVHFRIKRLLELRLKDYARQEQRSCYMR